MRAGEVFSYFTNCGISLSTCVHREVSQAAQNLERDPLPWQDETAARTNRSTQRWTFVSVFYYM